MTYDNYGNILTKNDKTYTYGNTAWKDLLTSYNGQTITYDSQGNPINYLGHTLTWEKGRQLKSFTKSDGTAISYTYNANGIRTSKTIDGITHTYTLDGAKILREAWTASGVHRYIIPLYDNEDAVCGINYCGTPFYFLKNLQGDVIAITNADGEVVARYQYDAWGVCTIASDTSGRNIAKVNPYRYRSYYYDAEIGMYYLQSRYYNPIVGRFVNGDDAECISWEENAICTNTFAYCKNSMVNTEDPSGYGPFLAIGIQFVINVGRLTVGLEALWSTSNWRFYLFGFVGGSRSFNIKSLTQTETALMEDIMYLVRSVRKFSISSFSIFKKMSISVSFVAVLGNKYASFPASYCGWFTGVSLTFLNITVSGAIGYSGRMKIGSLGIGVSTSKANVGFGQTYYFQLTGNKAFENNFKALKSGVSDKLARLKLFACFF